MTFGTPGGAVGAVFERGAAAFLGETLFAADTLVGCPEHDTAVTRTLHTTARRRRDRMDQE